MKINSDYDLEDPNDTSLALLDFALEQVRRDDVSLSKLARRVVELEEELRSIKESTCKCCHAKFGAEPVFSGEEDLTVGDEKKTTEACEGLGYKRPRGAAPTGYYW